MLPVVRMQIEQDVEDQLAVSEHPTQSQQRSQEAQMLAQTEVV